MNLLKLYKQYQFVFTELVKRDFKKKYKRSFLGVLWSMLSPLMMLLVLNFVFGTFFARNQEYYTIYLFSGWLIFQFYNDATNGAMNSLMANASIFSKVKVPKYMFLFSRVASSSINFFLTLLIYFAFVIAYGLPITWKFITLLYPIACLFLLILGIGAALHYNNPEDAQSVELQEKISAKGVSGAFAEVSGVTDSAVLEQVEAAYKKVEKLFQK